MPRFPDTLTQRLNVSLPIIQAPMAGSDSVALAVAVAKAGGLGSLACALMTPEQVRDAVARFRSATRAPLNLNFFCHDMPPPDTASEQAWRERLAPYYAEFGIDADALPQPALRMPFDAAMCAAFEDIRPEIVSFHFGLPTPELLKRVKATGAHVLASATSVREAVWLETHGCDVVIAQGAEAGGHRGMFLETDPAQQVGTLALVPQIVDAVKVPVIAAGGIADGRGIAAAFMLGASAVQLGTVYLFCPEANVSPLYRERLNTLGAAETVITNVFSGRPARGIVNRFVAEAGAIAADAPAFPYAASAVAPLRSASERNNSTDFMQMWAGQSAALSEALPARDLTLKLAGQARELLR